MIDSLLTRHNTKGGTNMSREDLLNGLYSVRDLVSKINQLADKQVRIESQVRKTISTSGVKTKSKLVVAAIAAVVYGAGLLPALFSGTAYGLFVCAFYTLLFVIVLKKRGQKSALKGFAWFVLIVGLLVGIDDMILHGYGIIILPALTILLFILILAAIKLRNAQINAGNEELKKAYLATVKPMQQLQKTLRAQCARIQYPEDYLDLNAVEFFIHGIKNYRANTLGQMVNLYEETNDRKRTIALQQEQLRLAQESNYNQQRILSELRYTNALHMFALSPQSQNDFLAYQIGYNVATSLFK